MRVIRQGAFETNSSSSHTMVLKNPNSGIVVPDLSNYDVKTDYEDESIKYVFVRQREYCGGDDILNDWLSKAEYLVAMVLMCTKNIYYNTKELNESEDMKPIQDAVKEVLGIEIRCTGDISVSKYDYGEEDGKMYMLHDAYIDHESVYDSMEDFMQKYGKDYNKEDVKDILFNPSWEINIIYAS